MAQFRLRPTCSVQIRRYRNGEERTNWGPNALFRYPINGTGSIWQAVFDSLPRERVHRQVEVLAIDAASKQLTLSTGYAMRYDAVISTMPMDRLATFFTLPDGLQKELDGGFKRQVSWGGRCWW